MPIITAKVSSTWTNRGARIMAVDMPVLRLCGESWPRWCDLLAAVTCKRKPREVSYRRCRVRHGPSRCVPALAICGTAPEAAGCGADPPRAGDLHLRRGRLGRPLCRQLAGLR